MNELIRILEAAKQKHGGDHPLTIGHLLNICKQAEKLKQTRAELEAESESRQHWEIMEAINNHGQD